jgi:hypothetical protein
MSAEVQEVVKRRKEAQDQDKVEHRTGEAQAKEAQDQVELCGTSDQEVQEAWKCRIGRREHLTGEAVEVQDRGRRNRI